MKKIFVLFIATALLLACATPQAVRDSEKVIKGEWVLNSITHNESGTYAINLFNDTNKDCFEGSTWKFIPNNNTGTYTINGAGCPVGERYFIFTIQEVDATSGYYDFLLKPTDERGKSETNQGFRTRLAHISESNMTWEQNLTFDGKPFKLIMNFTKN
ncbi:MAG: lipocalin family protein [Flavobacteriaceae bacterium]